MTPELAIGTELLATDPCEATTAAPGGPAKGFDLSNALGLSHASEVLTPEVAALGVLLATAVSLLASASGFGDEISKKTVLELAFWTAACSPTGRALLLAACAPEGSALLAACAPEGSALLEGLAVAETEEDKMLDANFD